MGGTEGEVSFIKHKQLPEAVMNDFPVKMQTLTINLPPEVEGYTDDIRRFIDAMIYKLGKNAHKGRWDEMTVERAIARLKEEVSELDEASGRESMTEMLLESADVANFALIVAAIAIERGK